MYLVSEFFLSNAHGFQRNTIRGSTHITNIALSKLDLFCPSWQTFSHQTQHSLLAWLFPQETRDGKLSWEHYPHARTSIWWQSSSIELKIMDIDHMSHVMQFLFVVILLFILVHHPTCFLMNPDLQFLIPIICIKTWSPKQESFKGWCIGWTECVNICRNTE